MTFIPFPKIARLAREMVITEKLDGTNAAVSIKALRPNERETLPFGTFYVERDGVEYAMWAQSRTRVIGPVALTGDKASDNFGFAAWVFENRQELVKLGEGTHFGEWWGRGIQRGYGLTERRFSLFNVHRWADGEDDPAFLDQTKSLPPARCGVVPVLYRGAFDTIVIDTVMEEFANEGSRAAPGFMKPEGIVVFHTASKQLFKKTFEKDDTGKEAA